MSFIISLSQRLSWSVSYSFWGVHTSWFMGNKVTKFSLLCYPSLAIAVLMAFDPTACFQFLLHLWIKGKTERKHCCFKSGSSPGILSNNTDCIKLGLCINVYSSTWLLGFLCSCLLLIIFNIYLKIWFTCIFYFISN